MPVEIRELQINVTVNQQGENSSAPDQSVEQEHKGEEARNLINHCIEEVMEIIHNNKER
jgi:hypothetical protein